MTARRALIVDDSKTALVRLRKMLERFDLQIDTAQSAEEALSYLSYRTPAVVFMDHMMPGLDGFEALKIIKSNPHTATIPIVMYTSKRGDLYVGQARALGAIDVLSKDVIQPSTLENVLRVIGIIRPDRQTVDAAPDPSPATSEEMPRERTAPTERLPTSPPEASDELQSIRRQVAKMLEINIAKVRHEISSQSRLLYKRLNRDIKELKERREPPPPPEPVEIEPEPPPAGERARSRLPELLILALLAVLVYQLIDMRGILSENSARARELESKLDESLVATRNNSRIRQDAPFASMKPLNLVAALQWGLNQNNQVEFGAMALGDENLVTLQELVSRLDAAGFAGDILLYVHSGDFCVVHDDGGDRVLPPPETSLEDCRRESEQVGSATLQDQMSVAFINYLVTSPVLNGGDIRVDVRHQGFAEPKFRYPEPTVPAGEWNRIAALNNRLEVELHPSAAQSGQP